MTKVCLIYHTKHGNCEKISQELGKLLSKKFEVVVKDVKEINTDYIANFNPDALIIGARIVIGKPDKKVRAFLEYLGRKLDKPIPKAATFYTHGEEWDEKYSTLIEILTDYKVCEDVYLEMLEVKMQKLKGPAEPGQEKKIENFAESVSNFILN